MRVALCCIARLENRYIREFVEHYKNLGFDKIYLYDNNHDGEETFDDILSDHISSKFVDVVNIRNKVAHQFKAYQDCYGRCRGKYDWVAFFDVDELLWIKDFDNVKEFLSQDKFNGFQAVKINWLCYGDNNLVTDDGRTMAERFTVPIQPLDFKIWNEPENCHVKSFVRCGLGNLKFKNPHLPCGLKNVCDSDGNKSDEKSPFSKPFRLDSVHLKHYVTKTIEEYLKYKVLRGLPSRKQIESKRILNTDYFFQRNERTPQKMEYIEKMASEKIEPNSTDQRHRRPDPSESRRPSQVRRRRRIIPSGSAVL